MKKNLLILFCAILCINKIHSQTNWELLNPKPTVNSGKDVDFVTNTIGYIITSNELLETQDAGNSWSKKQNIASGNDMSFYSTTGYIVGDNGYVLKSVDNGTSWNQIATGFSGNFNTITILDDNNIILSTSNSIVKTTDGGSTWESLSVPNATVVKTFFTSSLVGHATCANGTILKTTDGGVNWHTTLSLVTNYSNFYSIYFVNKNLGFSSQEYSNMYRTTDGGETWMEVSGNIREMHDFYFLDDTNGFASGEYGATYKTTDGGITWNTIFFENGFVGGNDIYGIYFEDNNTGYVTGVNGRIMKTTDGGISWTSNSMTYKNFNSIKLFSSGIGIARSGNNYYKTIDFGDNWSYLSTVNHFSYCNGFYFVNENVGYSVGGGTNSPSGDVFKTIDGGITWNQLNIYVDEGINSIVFLDQDTGFISGGFNRRKLMKTTDGGSNWTQILDQRFGQMQFLNNQVGYAINTGYSNGIVYKTTDGGNTWNVSIKLADSWINGFDFIDENNGYFVGDQGLCYKTNDGGTHWVQLQVPFGYYKKVNFYTKNVGYITDDYGSLFKTENGGITWQSLTDRSGINDIELTTDKIFTAGTGGRIYRSDVQYHPIVLTVNPAEKITNSSAGLAGNATSNGLPIANIQFEYSLDSSFSTSIAATPGTVAANDSSNVTSDLLNLQSNTTYYYRLTATQNSNIYYSPILSFITLPDYQIETNYTYNYKTTTAEISGTIVSNQHDITNVGFQYGMSADTLDGTISGSPTTVVGHTTENVTGNLVNLQPATRYYYRIKATHQGQDIYGAVQSFTTYPECSINLYSPTINGTDVNLTAYVTSYSQAISDIVFEYGTLAYENSISTDPSQVDADNSNYVSAILIGLDPNLNYYYRLKAMQNGQVIYSTERVFNFSGNIILVGSATGETPNALALKGLINSYGSYLTNIHFEYGVTNSFGSTLSATPNSVYGYNTNLISAIINDPLPNQTYYYRLVANNNGNVIYSDTYQYTTGTLSATDFELSNKIAIYPNPATDFVTIKSNTAEKAKSIEFYNVLGQRVHYENVSNISDIKIDVSNFKKGIYVVKVNFENLKVASSKLIMN
ncbi:YCF48-related protein [Flavobacterium sp. 5]|uniref:YCF48-related protein n=1 Tax=Flavobacterium sp. 5 TaxID=2035199 RepID=UPI000C2CD2D8|nr:YCF48-related protein [Flavobacterium sp. 5]PKB15273.1 putative secreted protein (Por secretion system target) [Flavobacterium sp. 5]